MHLTKSALIHHLLDLGLIGSALCVDGEFHVIEHAARNRLFRVSITNRDGYFVKNPLVFESNNLYTLWVEATVYWLVANDSAFRALRSFLPEFHHYDYHRHILILGLVPETESLHGYIWRTRSLDRSTTKSLAQILATLHGEVSELASRGSSLSLFSQHVAWALTLHNPLSCLYQPQNRADESILVYVRSRLGLGQRIELLRRSWSTSSVIHGDIKWSNFIIKDEDGEQIIKLVDWEIASLGDPLWDVAGIFCSYLLYGVQGLAYSSQVMVPRMLPPVFAILADFWRDYCNATQINLNNQDDSLNKSLQFAGVRLIQSCIESVGFAGRLDQDTYSILGFAEALISQPEYFSDQIKDAGERGVGSAS